MDRCPRRGSSETPAEATLSFQSLPGANVTPRGGWGTIVENTYELDQLFLRSVALRQTRTHDWLAGL